MEKEEAIADLSSSPSAYAARVNEKFQRCTLSSTGLKFLPFDVPITINIAYSLQIIS